MERAYRERRKIVADMLDNSGGDNWCQPCALIYAVDSKHRCGLYVVDAHEIKTRGRGGSIVNPDNIIAICRPGHEWIGRYPKIAQEIGLTKWSYEDE